MKILWKLLVVAGALTVSSASVLAQTFPARPIRILIGFATGTTVTSGRLIADDMSKRLGQPIFVEPMPGANGIIVSNAVARASADGYTLLYGSAITPSPVFNKENPVDLTRALAPVSQLVFGPYAFYVSSKLPVNSLKELVAWSKANPGKLNYASATPSFAMLAEGLKVKTGIDYTDIRYKGTDFVITAMAAGEVGFAASVLTGWASQVAAGTVKPLFIMAPQRSALWPEMITGAELGLDNFVAGTYLGLWAPLATPKDVIQRLNGAAVGAVRNPDVASRLRTQAIGVEPIGSTPEEHLRMVEADLKFWQDLARQAKFQPE